MGVADVGDARDLDDGGGLGLVLEWSKKLHTSDRQTVHHLSKTRRETLLNPTKTSRKRGTDLERELVCDGKFVQSFGLTLVSCRLWFAERSSGVGR
jgi:hypothetical protein